MYNIQKAVSRLDYAPKLKEIQITDIKNGVGVFTPKSEKAVSFAALKTALKKAGYALDSADINAVGTLARDGQNWTLTSDASGQRFSLVGEALDKLLADITPGTRVEMIGGWQTVGDGASARETISPSAIKRAVGANARKANGANARAARIAQPTVGASGVMFIGALFEPPHASPPAEIITEPAKPLAPIRTTTPGLTVYKGGALAPRLYFIKQHLGGLDVSRQLLNVSLSYTPSPRVQLEIEVPLSRTTFDDGASSGEGVGLGNITLWGKYRFFRSVKKYGDRQASARLGLELPTGRKRAPSESEASAPAFVRQQLTPISGGFSPHFDVAFSQAGGRIIFGGNAEAIIRTEREGFRMGHELRVNTDLEYVLLPRDYKTPGGELFVILETTFVQRGRGRLGGAIVEGSKATEYYLSPGLQYAARPRLVVEGSIQIPVVRNAGPLVLRNDINVLLGIKHLF